jgi:hypothetical protein
MRRYIEPRLWSRGLFSSILGGLLTRFVARALVVVAATVGIVFAQVVPASATVHEIVGQWCSRDASGKGELAPPGISPPTAKPENVAKPLFASGFLDEDPMPFQDGFLLVAHYENPNVKVIGTGNYVVIGEFQNQPLYIEEITTDSSFPAFQNCPNLVSAD